MTVHDDANKNSAEQNNVFVRLLQKFKSWKTYQKIFAIILILLIPTGAYASWYYYRISRPANLFDPPPIVAPPSDEEEKPVEVDWDLDNYFNKNIVNIVLLGLDGSESRDEIYSAYRTDTIKVVSINFDENTVHLIDIPRDSYTRIAETPTYDKINHAYYFGYKYSGNENQHEGGVEYALKSISNVLGGMPLTYYACVDMDAVVEMVNSIGGVKFDVPFDVYDTTGKLRIKEGERLLTGRQYLWYLRTRSVGGDIGRVHRQTDLLLATLDHLRNEGMIKNIPTIYSTYQDLIQTNLSNQQMIALAMYVGKLGSGSIEQHTLKGGGQRKDGIYYMVLDAGIKAEVMREVFGIDYTAPRQEKLTDTKPGTPRSFSVNIVEQADKKAVSLAWVAGSNNQEFTLYRSVNGGAEARVANKQEEKGYLDTDVEAGSSYTYRLEAVNYRALSDSISASITVPKAVTPTPAEPEEPAVPEEPEEPEEPTDPEPEPPVDESEPPTEPGDTSEE
ncbi:MAG: LCP family protein [Firmicutes bacterium]|nr:LCP family protein [Bacillota bacterium]